MRKVINIITLVIIAALLAAVSLFNIFQTNRPTQSLEEQRTLAEFPVFSWQSLTDGSFFSGIDSFVSDTFIGREQLIALSKKMELARGITSDKDIVFIPVTPVDDVNDEDEFSVPTVTDSPDSAKDPETDISETSSPDTDLPETDPPETDSPESEPEDTDPSETDLSDGLTAIILNKENTTLTIGGSVSLNATVEPEELIESTKISWYVSDKNIVSIRAESDQIIVTALAEGSVSITAKTKNGLSAVCEIKVIKSAAPGSDVTGIGDAVCSDEPEILTNGMIIYNGAVYSIPYLVEKNARYYAQTMEYYDSLFKDAQVSSLIAPLSSSLVEEPSLKKRITDQKKMISTIGSYMSDGINNIEIYDELFAHRDEYLYFKSDHHWTQRGAYYAYKIFAESVGFEAAPLSDFEEVLLNDAFQGTMYSYTKDERVKLIYDSVYAYIPPKEHTMTIYYSNGSTKTFDSSITRAYKSYQSFINGDNPYTIINVPENPQDCNILVFKDSYGNAMIPFLTEHYGNILVVDPRYVNFNVYDLLKDYPLRDILFLNNIYNPNVAGWTRNLLRSVGVTS